MPELSNRAGEVIEASTTDFVAQCYELYDAPPLGSLVRTGSDPIYGIVHGVATRSMDPARHPIPRGRDEDGEEWTMPFREGPVRVEQDGQVGFGHYAEHLVGPFPRYGFRD